ncbi:Cadherin-11 [Ilyodon furcidens]|uniref:Cadherin-11 n=2 Tax=Goodeidae TaxID=28758 RepID=A0ABV0T7P8_9TELE
MQVTATDADDPTYGNSARLVYSILQGQPYFSVEPQTGIIRTALPNMDREARQEYDVVIQAKDMGGHMGGLSGTTEVKITLTDVNDNPPKFPQSVYSMSVSEDKVPGEEVGRLKAKDPDLEDNGLVNYRLIDGDGISMFELSTNSETREAVIKLRKDAAGASTPEEADDDCTKGCNRSVSGSSTGRVYGSSTEEVCRRQHKGSS